MKARKLWPICITVVASIGLVGGFVLLHRWQFPYGQKVGALPLVLLALREYGIEHDGWFPHDGQTPLQSLQALYPKYIDPPRYLAGLTGDADGTMKALQEGRPLDEKVSSWIYWPGLVCSMFTAPKKRQASHCLSLAPSSGNARVNSRNTPQNSSTPKWSQYMVCGGLGSAKRGVSLRVGPVPLPPGTGKVIA